jgi:2-amino-4-hydroxy-6-hydroxymethyldihydropteridine diphosphokinase
MNDCIIGIGSNIEADVHIPRMLKLLEDHFNIVKVSSMIQTKAIGMSGQPDYTNGAVRILTAMQMDELAAFLKQLEDQMGRDRRQPKFGPRNIDLDIMVWNNKVVDPDYYTRDFLRHSAEELGFINRDT